MPDKGKDYDALKERKNQYHRIISIIVPRLAFNAECDNNFKNPCIKTSGLYCAFAKCVCQSGFQWNQLTYQCGTRFNLLYTLVIFILILILFFLREKYIK